MRWVGNRGGSGWSETRVGPHIRCDTCVKSSFARTSFGIRSNPSRKLIGGMSVIQIECTSVSCRQRENTRSVRVSVVSRCGGMKLLGWVYVLSHPNMPKLVKVGQSSQDPDIRANELYTTGLPGPFHIEYKGLFENYAQLERLVHTFLSEHRVNNNREFFEIEPHVAITAIITCASNPPLYQSSSQKSHQGIENTNVKLQNNEIPIPFSMNINWDEPNETKTISFRCEHCRSYSEHRVNKRVRSSVCRTCGWKSEYQ